MTSAALPAKTKPTGNARRRSAQREKAEIVLPEVPPHHHVGPCDCELTRPYIRVSSMGSRDKIVSPQIQLDEIVADSIRSNRRLLPPYFDLKSGKSLKGRKIEMVVEEIKNGDYRYVAVWKWSRWGRNNLQSLQMCDAVDTVGGLVVSATEAFDTKTPTGEFIRDMLLAQAAWQSRLIGEGWRSAQRLRREADLPHSGRERWGYIYTPATRTTPAVYESDDEETEHIRDAYVRLTAGTISIGKLVVEWNMKGLVTTMGGPWTEQGLAQMLDTGFAAGYIRERSNPGPKRVRNNIRVYDIWRLGGHDPIIDEELWQRYRAKREATCEMPPRLHVAVHELSRLMFCGLCTRRLSTHYSGRQTSHNWKCTHRASMHPDKSVLIANSIVRTAVRVWVKAVIVAEDDRSAELAERAQTYIDKAPKAVSETDRLMDVLASIKRRRDRLRGLYVSGIDPDLDEPTYKRELAPLISEEQAARAELARTRVSESKVGLATLLPVFKRIDEWWDDPEMKPEERNAMLSQVVGMVIVSPRTSVSRSESGLRVKVVPVWEMDEWAGWLSAKRRNKMAA